VIRPSRGFFCGRGWGSPALTLQPARRFFRVARSAWTRRVGGVHPCPPATATSTWWVLPSRQFVPATVGAMVGHSLGGDIALGVADDPPPGLRAVVLVDGGYLEPMDRVELGAPDAADREAMVASMRENEARFPDWETARGEIAKFVGTEELTPETEAAFRESLTEIDGELREAAPPERAADLLMSIASAAIDVRTRAAAVCVPTLLIAAGQPPESREIKQRAWGKVRLRVAAHRVAPGRGLGSQLASSEHAGMCRGHVGVAVAAPAAVRPAPGAGISLELLGGGGGGSPAAPARP
jgi:pimeloyl-ACP methyl ester carboxylesterase